MAFRFRLQAVLEHRRHQQEAAMAELAVKLGSQTQCEQQIAWLEKEFRAARGQLGLRQSGSMAAKDFVLANEYLTVLRLTALREQARLPALRAETEQARLKLVEADRRCRVLEKLRQRHKEAYDRQEMLKEQRLLDEVAVGAYARRLVS